MSLRIALADYAKAEHMQGLLNVLDDYARSPSGGGEALSPQVWAELPAQLQSCSSAFSLLAWQDEEIVGLMNCFVSLSTFKARPLLNLHDFAVLQNHQGQGIGLAMMAALDEEAKKRGACKITLEVLQGNTGAQKLYRRAGYQGYELSAEMGHALFWEKAL